MVGIPSQRTVVLDHPNGTLKRWMDARGVRYRETLSSFHHSLFTNLFECLTSPTNPGLVQRDALMEFVKDCEYSAGRIAAVESILLLIAPKFRQLLDFDNFILVLEKLLEREESMDQITANCKLEQGVRNLLRKRSMAKLAQRKTFSRPVTMPGYDYHLTLAQEMVQASALTAQATNPAEGVRKAHALKNRNDGHMVPDRSSPNAAVKRHEDSRPGSRRIASMQSIIVRDILRGAIKQARSPGRCPPVPKVPQAPSAPLDGPLSRSNGSAEQSSELNPSEAPPQQPAADGNMPHRASGLPELEAPAAARSKRIEFAASGEAGSRRASGDDGADRFDAALAASSIHSDADSGHGARRKGAKFADEVDALTAHGEQRTGNRSGRFMHFIAPPSPDEDGRLTPEMNGGGRFSGNGRLEGDVGRAAAPVKYKGHVVLPTTAMQWFRNTGRPDQHHEVVRTGRHTAPPVERFSQNFVIWVLEDTRAISSASKREPFYPSLHERSCRFQGQHSLQHPTSPPPALKRTNGSHEQTHSGVNAAGHAMCANNATHPLKLVPLIRRYKVMQLQDAADRREALNLQDEEHLLWRERSSILKSRPVCCSVHSKLAAHFLTCID